MRRRGLATDRVLGLVGVWLVGLALTGASVQAQGRGLTPQERQQTLAQAALIVAEKMYRGGQIDRAMNHWREALSYDPNLVQAHYLLGLALRDQGELEESLKHLRTTTKLDPQNANAFADLGDTLHEQGDVDGALQAYGTALRLVPESASVRSNYGKTGRGGWRTALRLAYANLKPGRPGSAKDAIAAYQPS